MLKAAILFFQLFTALWPRECDTLKMVFLGDIMQHEAQLKAAQSDDGNPNNPLTYNYSSYFQHLGHYFYNADIVAANIETTFGPAPYTGYPRFCSPYSLATEAQNSGINLFFTANNHSVDKGTQGLKGSIELFEEMEIFYTGIYKDSSSAAKSHPLILEIKGFRIALLNYTYGTNGFDVPHPYVVNLLDSNSIKRDFKRAALFSPHSVIVSVHWGEEYQLTPSAHQKKWERLFYNYGANLIIGSHPHVPQEVVAYQDSAGKNIKITAYSLGNAISNMSAKNTRVGIMLEVDLIKEHFTNRVWFSKPRSHYIWTGRPNSIESNYTIIPMKEYVENPDKFNRREEQQLILNYFKIFHKELDDQ